MERPAKRQRIALGSLGTDDEDELDCEPNELNQRRDPAYQLEQARFRASNKLKSRFEDIFAKYEKDFTGVGDEIDLRTGEVVVDNGHLQSITGVQEFGDTDGDEDDNVSENERLILGTGNGGSRTGSSDAVTQSNPWVMSGSNPDWARPSASMRVPTSLSSLGPPAHELLVPPNNCFDPRESANTQDLDPVWQAPELPRSAFLGQQFGAQAQKHRFGMGQTTKKVSRRSLLEPRNQDGDEEDVLGAPGNDTRKKESPLIKARFPAVGSSPNNDSGLHEMIQDVIDNIADMSPSAEKLEKGPSGTGPSTKTKLKPIRSNPGLNGRRCTERTCDDQGNAIRKAGEAISRRENGASPEINRRRGCKATADKPQVKAVKIRKITKPETHTENQAAETIGESGIPGMDEDSFLDITGNTPTKPAGQVLYVEIKARKLGQSDCFARDDQDDSEVQIVDTGLSSADVSGRGLHTSSSVAEKVADTQDDNCATESDRSRLDDEPTRSKAVDEPLGRRKTNETFAFSCEEDLPSRTVRNQKRPPASAGTHDRALQQSQANMPSHRVEERFERNFVDPSYAFSDDEDLLPRSKRNNQRNSEPRLRANIAAHDVSRVASKSKAAPTLQTKVGLDAWHQESRDQLARMSPKPIVERDSAADALEVSKLSHIQSSENMDSAGPTARPSSASHRQSRGKWPGEAGVKQAQEQVTGMAGTHALKHRFRKNAVDDVHGVPGTAHASASAAASTAVEANVERTSAKPPKTAQTIPVPPTTPQPKSKPRSEKTPSSTSGLISLLSDDDDEEDEISFDLADFTPSGNHRILALRPHHHQSPASSTSKKRRGGNLLFGPASTTKMSKHSTPSSDSQQRKKKRRSTHSLARSVVKVRRESSRALSPVGSVVQTPGGTKRRCGEDGFRCERDFCFVCISI
ncbi:hypothetical protein N8I77_012773 [Diaporthe amygdali]|uniref:Uncharacterized protein n=1 Tax=Phomopsis amygdali TaxID=1214568 RepID=A0AAD9S4I4_PHOAM|nr:hypothetical protein N8I77_012773 [Diaporthe amygdali]